MIKKKRYKIIKGVSAKPRLSIFRSNLHTYAQIINDEIGHTLCSVSTLENKNNNINFKVKKRIQAYNLGIALAKLCLNKNINNIAFDSKIYSFSGRIKNFVKGAQTINFCF